MRPFYDARVSDLGAGDLVRVECVCGHVQLLTGAMHGRLGPARPNQRPGSTYALSGM